MRKKKNTKAENNTKIAEMDIHDAKESVKVDGEGDGINPDSEERREYRHKRRIRNQVYAYITVLIFTLALAFGIVYGVKTITGKIKGVDSDISVDNTNAQDESQLSQQDKVDELLSGEGELNEPQPTAETVEISDEQKLDAIIDSVIEVMPIEDKIAGLFLVTPESITGVNTAVKAGSGTQKALADYSVGGIIYQSKNIQSQSQIKEMINNTKVYSRYSIFIAIAEEGGSNVNAAKSGVGTAVSSAKEIGEGGDTSKAYEAGTTIGEYLSGVGFNLNFAPVADLNNVENSAVGDRSYGSDAATVSGYVTSMLNGLEDGGITACMGAFPGSGSTTEDPGKGRASTDRTEADFRAEEFEVFKAGIEAGAKMILVSNVSAPNLSGDNIPCTMSDKVVTEILRKELGFNGVIISDAMNDKAVADYYGADEAAVRALRAGCDMILMPEDFEKAYKGVLEAVNAGNISEERINDSLKRIYRIKYADRIGQ